MNLIYNEAEFLNSEKILFHQTLNFNFRLRDMQLAPNNKIYITFNDYYLWSIDNPDLPVPFCSVNNQSLWLNGVKSGVYLPNYFSYYINFSFRQLCSHVDFSYIGVAGSHCFWNFGDGQTSTAINPTHAYTNAGTYTVTLEVTLSDNTSQTITKTIEIFNKPTNVLIEHD
jgi:hypothetical protein